MPGHDTLRRIALGHSGACRDVAAWSDVDSTRHRRAVADHQVGLDHRRFLRRRPTTPSWAGVLVHQLAISQWSERSPTIVPGLALSASMTRTSSTGRTRRGRRTPSRRRRWVLVHRRPRRGGTAHGITHRQLAVSGRDHDQPAGGHLECAGQASFRSAPRTTAAPPGVSPGGGSLRAWGDAVCSVVVDMVGNLAAAVICLSVCPCVTVMLLLRWLTRSRVSGRSSGHSSWCRHRRRASSARA